MSNAKAQTSEDAKRSGCVQTKTLRASALPREISALFLLLILTFFGGCGSGDKNPRYKVAGKVTHQGQPVERGDITFEDPTAGQVNSSPLGSGGSYSLEVPAGDYKVSIAPPQVETKGTADSPPDHIPDPNVKNIPKKYWTIEKSGLTAQVAKDKKSFDFDLKP